MIPPDCICQWVYTTERLGGTGEPIIVPKLFIEKTCQPHRKIIDFIYSQATECNEYPRLLWTYKELYYIELGLFK